MKIKNRINGFSVKRGQTVVFENGDEAVKFVEIAMRLMNFKIRYTNDQILDVMDENSKLSAQEIAKKMKQN